MPSASARRQSRGPAPGPRSRSPPSIASPPHAGPSPDRPIRSAGTADRRTASERRPQTNRPRRSRRPVAMTVRLFGAAGARRWTNSTANPATAIQPMSQPSAEIARIASSTFGVNIRHEPEREDAGQGDRNGERRRRLARDLKPRLAPTLSLTTRSAVSSAAASCLVTAEIHHGGRPTAPLATRRRPPWQCVGELVVGDAGFRWPSACTPPCPRTNPVGPEAGQRLLHAAFGAVGRARPQPVGLVAHSAPTRHEDRRPRTAP